MGRVTHHEWSKAHDALLTRLWPTVSAAKIAPLVGRTRNAVIGRAARLKLMRKGAPRNLAPKRTPHASRRTNQRPTSLADKNVGAIQESPGVILPALATSLAAREGDKAAAPIQFGSVSSLAIDAGASEISPFAPLAPVALPVPLLELRRASCRYIVEGEGEYALFCNADRDEGSPYCCFHHARCSYKPDKRLRAA